MYIYPDNLSAKATLWLWELRDIGIIGVGLLLSVLALTQTCLLYTSDLQTLQKPPRRAAEAGDRF